VAFHAINNPNTRAGYHGSIDALPDGSHDSHEGLRGIFRIEVQINAHEVWIVDWPEDAIAEDARCLAAGGVAIKGHFPPVEVADRVLDLDGVHFDSL
jgi:hypothetical protein